MKTSKGSSSLTLGLCVQGALNFKAVYFPVEEVRRTVMAGYGGREYGT